MSNYGNKDSNGKDDGHGRFNFYAVFLIFESADSLPLKLNQLSPIRSDFHETLQRGYTAEYLQIHRRDFRYLSSK